MLLSLIEVNAQTTLRFLHVVTPTEIDASSFPRWLALAVPVWVAPVQGQIKTTKVKTQRTKVKVQGQGYHYCYAVTRTCVTTAEKILTSASFSRPSSMPHFREVSQVQYAKHTRRPVDNENEFTNLLPMITERPNSGVWLYHCVGAG